MSGATIHNPCVNKSDVDANVCGGDVYLGLSILKGLSGGLITSIITERECSGEYASLEDFIERINIGIESVQTLIFIGAFRFTGKPKSELIVRARQLLVNYKPENKTPLLIQAVKKAYKLPILQRSVLEDAFDEIELLSFPVSCSPFDLLQTKYRGDVLAKDLLQYVNREVRMLAYLVSTKQVPTKKGMMYFGTWIDVAGDYFDTAHFPKSLQQYKFRAAVVTCYWERLWWIITSRPSQSRKWQRCPSFLTPVTRQVQENNLRFIEKSGKTKAIPTDYLTRRNMKLVCRGRK
jgi:DNA polymerase III alpha subunit